MDEGAVVEGAEVEVATAARAGVTKAMEVMATARAMMVMVVTTTTEAEDMVVAMAATVVTITADTTITEDTEVEVVTEERPGGGAQRRDISPTEVKSHRLSSHPFFIP